MHASLTKVPSNLVGGSWIALDAGELRSINPARPSQIVWHGRGEVGHVRQAVDAARTAFEAFRDVTFERRAALLRKYAELCKVHAERIAAIITDETGKTLWESRAEAAALWAKVEITLDAGAHSGLSRVSPFSFDLAPTRAGRCVFRPHGVMAIVGPYNFPAHLPNGHFVPALAMGNTVVFKPSDKAPGVGQMLGEIMLEALEAENLPPGVFNVVQGGAAVAQALVTHDDIDGILFTGSWPVGRKILEANLDRPGRIVALEMGGNNPAVVLADADLKQAAIEIARSAFVTTGQRCTCTRRVIAHEAIADRLFAAVAKIASNLIVGDPRAEHPVFYGPIISQASRQAVLEFQSRAARSGSRVWVESSAMSGEGFYVTPSMIEVDCFTADDGDDAGCDVEVFGPLLRVTRCGDLDEAIAQANATRYGLAASIFTRDQRAAERFVSRARAGCINVNTGTAGASSKLPFGGLGLSGNHRPAGSFSLDYCAMPIAQMIERGDGASLAPGMTFEPSWLG